MNYPSSCFLYYYLTCELLDAFFEAGKEFGYEVNDPNDEQMLGFSQVQATTRLVNLYPITRNGNFDEIFH